MLSKTQRFSVVRVLFCVALGIGLPMDSLAHVKWFAGPGVDHFIHSFTRAEIGFSVTLLMLGICVAKFLSNYCLKQGGIFSSQVTMNIVPFRIFQYLVAFYLIGCVMSGNFLVPHVNANVVVMYIGLILQTIAAIGLLWKRFPVVVSASLYLSFFTAGIIEHSFLLEYLLVAGIAWVILTGQRVPSDFMIIILRITLGISLIALALTEKLLQPELAFNVLSQHPLNFMQQLGFNFSDSWFVLGAGMVELFIGLLFVLGLMVRTTTIVVFGLMVASNSYFFWIDNYSLAVMELIGHLPVFAVGILLLFYYGKNTHQSYKGGSQDVIAGRTDVAVEGNFSIEST